MVTEQDTGPLQRGEEEPLFLESELEEGAKARTEVVGSEIPRNAATELMEALRVQTSAMQGHACIREQLCAQMEQLLNYLNQHRSLQQELLEALQVAAWDFRHGLGSGLETWARIAMGWEEWSEGEGDEGQGWRHGWNNTLSYIENN